MQNTKDELISMMDVKRKHEQELRSCKELLAQKERMLQSCTGEKQ